MKSERFCEGTRRRVLLLEQWERNLIARVDKLQERVLVLELALFDEKEK